MKPRHFFYHFLILVLVSQLCWAQRLKPGVYVNEKNPKSYVEIKSGKDSLFYLAGDDGAYYGKYLVKDDTLICFTDYGYGGAFLIRTDNLINLFNTDDKWLFWKGGKTASEYAKEKRLWLHIKPGQTEESLTLTRGGEVIFSGNKIGKIEPFYPEYYYLSLSPPSPKKNLSLCLFTEIDRGPQQTYILDMKNKRVLSNLKVIAGYKWINWTPDENYIVTADAPYEGSGMYLYVIDITRDKITESSRVPFKLAKEKEIEEIDFEGLRWISPKTFQVRVDITCNYYLYTHEEFENENYPCRDERILRSYDVQVNISMLSVSYKRIK